MSIASRAGRHRDLLPGTDGIDDGDRPHQAVRVRMERPAEQHLAGTGFHDAPPVHDRHPRAEESDHREIVGDEEVRKVVLALELAEEIQHLSLDRDVEGRDRLVEHDEARRGRERARHRDALTLPAGHLRWTATKELGAEPDELEQLDHARPPGFRSPDPVHDERGGDDRGDGAPAVERARRILEHRGQGPPYRPQLVASKPCQGTALELDRPAVDLRQAEDGIGDRRLARARLADQPERLTRADGEGDPVNGTDDSTVPDAEVLLNPCYLEQRGRAHRGAPRAAPLRRALPLRREMARCHPFADHHVVGHLGEATGWRERQRGLNTHPRR